MTQVRPRGLNARLAPILGRATFTIERSPEIKNCTRATVASTSHGRSVGSATSSPLGGALRIFGIVVLLSSNGVAHDGLSLALCAGAGPRDARITSGSCAWISRVGRLRWLGGGGEGG